MHRRHAYAREMRCMINVLKRYWNGAYVSRARVQCAARDFFEHGFSLQELITSEGGVTLDVMKIRMGCLETSHALYQMFYVIFQMSGGKDLAIVKDSIGVPNENMLCKAYFICAFPDLVFPGVMTTQEVDLFNACHELVVVIHQFAGIVVNLGITNLDLIETEIGYTCKIMVKNFISSWFAWVSGASAARFAQLVRISDPRVSVVDTSNVFGRENERGSTGVQQRSVGARNPSVEEPLSVASTVGKGEEDTPSRNDSMSASIV